MRNFDDDVLGVFLDKQNQLYDENVAETLDEADDFLTEVCATLFESKDEIVDFFREEIMFDADDAEILEAIEDSSEVFDIGDGRYLAVEL